MVGSLDITEVKGRQLLDSQGRMAVEAEVTLENNARGRAMISVEHDGLAGEAEALINDYLSEAVLYEDGSGQTRIDCLLVEAAERAPFGKGGRSATLSLSMAVCRAAGAGLLLPLYRYLGGSSSPSMPVPIIGLIGSACGTIIRMEDAKTVTEALALVDRARALGRRIILSAGSHETDEPFFADFAVAVKADYVDFGPCRRGEFTAKYNEFLRIEEFYSQRRSINFFPATETMTKGG